MSEVDRKFEIPLSPIVEGKVKRGEIIDLAVSANEKPFDALAGSIDQYLDFARKNNIPQVHFKVGPYTISASNS